MDSSPLSSSGYRLPGQDKYLGEMSADDLQLQLEAIKQKEQDLEPEKQRTFSGWNVVESVLMGSAFTGAAGAAFTGAGLALTAALPLSVLGGAFILSAGGMMAVRQQEHRQASQERYTAEVAVPKMHIMEALQFHGKLSENDKAELDRLKTSEQTLDTRTVRQQEEVARLREALENALNQNERTGNAFNQIDRQNTELRTQLHDAKEKLEATLRQEWAVEWQAFEQRTEDANKKVKDLQKQLEINQLATQEIEAKLQLEQQNAHGAKEEMEQLKGAQKLLQNEKGQLDETLKQTEEALASLKTTYGNLENEKNEAVENARESKESLEQLGTQLKTITGKLEAEQKEFDQALQQRAKAFERQRKKMKADLTVSRVALRLVKRAKDTASKDLKARGNTILTKDQEIGQLQQQLQRNTETHQQQVEQLTVEVKSKQAELVRAYGKPRDPNAGYNRTITDKKLQLKVELLDIDDVRADDKLETVFIERSDTSGLAAKNDLLDEVRKAQHTLSEKVKKAQNTYDPAADGLPSLSVQRLSVIEALEEYQVSLHQAREAFQETKGESEAHETLLRKLDEALEVVDAKKGANLEEERVFQEKATDTGKAVDAWHDNCRNVDMGELAEKTDTVFQATLLHPAPEARDYSVGMLLKSLAEQIEGMPMPAPLQMRTLDQLEEQRQILEEKKKLLQSYHPENLPLDMSLTLSPRAIKYMEHVVGTTIQSLEEATKPEQLPDSPHENSAQCRNEPGTVIARKLLDNQETCASVYSLLSSLQTSHAGDVEKKDFNYYRASQDGLEVIRHDHGLVYMPTMQELLTVAQHDLNQVDSKLAAMAAREHRDSTTKQSGQLRRESLFEKCTIYLDKENEDADEVLRGQSQNGQKQLSVHPAKAVLDCFAGANGGCDLEVDEGRRHDGVSHWSYPVADNNRGLMNKFLAGCDKATLQVNKKTDEQLLSIGQATNPAGVVFKKGASESKWKVSLGGTNWWVDPSILIQNPDIDIPFESGDGLRLQRDWIPLRDIHGNTSILVLRKTPAMGYRYFLYELDGTNRLTPKPIGSKDLVQERREAVLLYEAGLSSSHGHDEEGSGDEPRSLSSTATKVATQKPQELIQGLRNCNRHWISNANTEKLKQVFDQIERGDFDKAALPPLKTEDLSALLCGYQVKENELRKIALTKKESERRVGAATKTYACGTAKFTSFSVGAEFDAVHEKYFAKMAKESADSPLIKSQKVSCEDYRSNVFQDLPVFVGCELNPGLNPKITPDDEGAPSEVVRHFNKVVKNNRDHCLRMSQQVGQMRRKIADTIRQNHPVSDGQIVSELNSFTDQQILDKAVMDFEKGLLPNGLRTEDGISLLVTWMQAENDLGLHSRMKHELVRLQRDLGSLHKDAAVQFDEDNQAYRKRCQDWNLRMALQTKQVQDLHQRLDSYKDSTLNEETRAVMSFERRSETVLRSGIGSDQVAQVNLAAPMIMQAMGEGDGTMSLVSQLGTGFGKSTTIPLWCDLACSLNAKHEKKAERSVMVIAPTRNKLDLDRMLGRYYDQKGLTYQSLDLMEDYVRPKASSPKPWWRGDALDKIHNTLLGIPANTPADQREAATDGIRAPAGASIQDVQILVNLRHALENKEDLDPADQQALIKLNGISDLFRESMIFADEWDSAMVPPFPGELDEVQGNVNLALKKADTSITSGDITQRQGAFIFGCKRKYLLSATYGTPFTAAVASGATNPDEVANKCNSDPYTTLPRVMHWLAMGEPVFVDSSEAPSTKEVKQNVFDHVVGRCGVDRPVIMFNSESDSRRNFEEARENLDCLQQARSRVSGKQIPPSGMLYYGPDKTPCQFMVGDATYDDRGDRRDAPIKPEDRALMTSPDVTLGKDESVGTDAPQTKQSVSVYLGLFEQKQVGRLDLTSQQLGRGTRATRTMHDPQQLFVVVDKSAIDQLEDSSEKEKYLHSYKTLQMKEKELTNLFPKGVPEGVKQAMKEPVKVKPAHSDGLEKLNENLEDNLKAELQRHKMTIWNELKLTAEQTATLKQLKMIQWDAKVNYLELTAAELARRDVNPHINSYESKLHQAAVDSAMDDALSKEDRWMKGLGKKGGLLKDFRFTSNVTDHLPEDTATDPKQVEPGLTIKYLRDEMASEAGRKLDAIKRRKVPAGLGHNDLVVEFHSERTRQQVEEVFEQIKTRGLEFKGVNPVTAMSQSLVSASERALNDAKARLQKIRSAIEGQKSTVAGSGREHNKYLFDTLMKRVDDQLMAIKDSEGFDAAFKTDQFLNDFYSDLFLGLQFAAVSGSVNVTERNEIVSAVSVAVRGLHPNYKLELHNSNLGNIKKACKSLDYIKEYKNLKTTQDPDVSASIHTFKWVASSKKTANPTSKPINRVLKREEIFVPRFVPDKLTWSGGTAPTTGAGPAMETYGELQTLCDQGQKARHCQNCWEQAKKVKDGNDALFSACVDELKSAVLEDYAELEGQINDQLGEATHRIDKQVQLMAAATA